MGCIGVDLDGALAYQPHDTNVLIGPPIQRMILRVQY